MPAREWMGYSPDAPSVCSLFFAFLDSALCPRRPASVVPSHRLPCPEERMEGRKGRVIYSHLPLRLPAPFQLVEVLSELPSYCPLVTLLSQAHLPSGAALTGIWYHCPSPLCLQAKWRLWLPIVCWFLPDSPSFP